jgi:sodium-dependent dicarboxylate transporter 2/3/5
MSFNSMDQMNKGKGGYAAAVPKKRKPKSNENTKVLMKAMLLAVAYAANIGGIGTLIGTPVNLILQTQMETVFENNLNKDKPEGIPANELNFLSWMYFALPTSIVCNIGCWLWLIAVYMGPAKVWADMKKRHETPEDIRVKDMIRKKYDDLGKPSYEEWVVGFHFVTLAILWFTRSPKFISGWQAAFEPGHVKDSTAALAICFSLFLWPSKPNFLNFLRGARYESDGQNMPKPASPILDWKTCQKTLAWDVIILLGAGFALADACQSSDLSELLGQSIGSMMGSINAKFLPFLISLMISFITGFTSNTSTASVFIPIIASLCVELNLNPLYLCIPVTFACSFAFILPIATPPNAIAFSYGYLETVDMIKVGTLLNILCVLVTAMLLPIIAFPAYSLGEFPAWAVMTAEGAGDVLVNATMTTLDVVAST